jgi:hypothetical protein
LAKNPYIQTNIGSKNLAMIFSPSCPQKVEQNPEGKGIDPER